ncbi:MAG: hypothetical protein A2277_08380 [Desulfobacterales bacterium RIFOXYA12_FULL_46_15]|nr:MAG: hypothetical protein A2277_08380 [Desulfobacterales bacterium RIFOXYA12_FULL_46_15]
MSGRSKEKDRERSWFWKNHLDQWSRSGITQNAYCKANDLKSNRMTYWKNIFKRRSAKLRQDHSLLKASTGSTREARQAGTAPDRSPIKTARSSA